jgi:PKD repeat protein
VHADSQTLTPNGSPLGDTDNWSAIGSPTLLECVDDWDNTDYVMSDAFGPWYLVYPMDDVAAGSGYDVRIEVKVKAGAVTQFRFMLQNLAEAKRYSSSFTPGTAWVVKDYTWPLSPFTSTEWTQSEINSLLAGFQYQSGEKIEIGALRLYVTYTPPPPPVAGSPSPSNGAIEVPLSQSLSWGVVPGATSYDIYFGTFTGPPFQINQPGASWTPAGLSSYTTYYWRIDAKNAGGTTTGLEWSFRTTDNVNPLVEGSHLQNVSYHMADDGHAYTAAGAIPAGTVTTFVDYNSITEANPEKTTFVIMKEVAGGSVQYLASTETRDEDTVTPIPFAFNTTEINGAYRIFGRVQHRDKSDNFHTSESPYYHVKPYTPQAPTVSTIPGNYTSLTVDVNPHTSEHADVPYHISCTTLGKSVHPNGSLLDGAWFYTDSEYGTVTVLGLQPSTEYTFQVLSHNYYDPTLSDFSPTASATTDTPPPVADFVATPTSGDAPLVVSFADASTGTITSWEWDFDYDFTVDSFSQNDTHVYNFPGVYSVKLTVSGPGGDDEEIKTDYITVFSGPPQITFLNCWDSAGKSVQYDNDTWHSSGSVYFEFGNDSQCDVFQYYWGTDAAGVPIQTMGYNPSIPGGSFEQFASGDGNWYCRVRANRGASSGPISTFVFKLDSTPPVTIIQFPEDGSYVNSVPSFYGNSVDSGCGLSNVQISLRRVSTSSYWDGTDYTSPSEIWHDAAVSSPTWSYSDGDLYFSSGQDYVLRAKGSDNVGNWGTPVSSTFTYDTIPPMAPDPCYCEDRINPSEVAVDTPGFIGFNEMEDILLSHIQVGDSPDLDGDVIILWDSGLLSTPTPVGQNTSEIGYNGSPLSPNVSYYWRMAFIDRAGNVSNWSVVQQFSLAPQNIYVDGASGDDAYNGLTWGTAVKTIQKGIDLAVDGVTTVWVADGTYTGTGNKNLNLGGKAITVKSDGGPESCIIDCESSGRAFNFFNSESHSTVIEGFTIQNGNVGGDNGGGIRLYGSEPKFYACIIKLCSATYGGGVYAEGIGESPYFINCVIGNNSATSNGGGLCNIRCNIYVKFCVIVNNEAAVYGGGICVDAFAYTYPSNSIIQFNNAGTDGNQIYQIDWDSEMELYYTAYSNGTNDVGGNGYFAEVTGCIVDSDPLFTDLASLNLRLLNGSPCIDAGCNAYISGDITGDICGNPRVWGSSVDIGCYETDPVPSAPTALLTNGRSNPVSVGDSEIRFSAIYSDSGLPTFGNTAWVQVDNDSGFTSTCWDSGWLDGTGVQIPSGNRSPGIFYEGEALIPGMTYYWRIRFGNELGQEGDWSIEEAYFKLAQYTVNLENAGWHLLEIPCYTGTQTVQELLGDDLGIIWIWRYSEAARKWIQVGAGETFQNGVGYFAWCKNPGEVAGFNGEGITGATDPVLLSWTNTASFGNDGWNLVRHPYPKALSWSSYAILQNCETTYWHPWNGDEYLLYDKELGGCASGTLPPGASFWVHANGSNSQITFIEPPSAAPQLLPPPVLNWKVRFEANTGAYRDTQSYIGARHGALLNHDQYDILKIRSYSLQYIRVFFDHPEWGVYSGPYAFDTQPFPAEGGTLSWKMKVHATDANGTVNLSWHLPEELLYGWRFHIRDDYEGIVRDMTLFDSHQYPAGGADTREFTVTATQFRASLLGDADLDGTVTETDAALCARAEHGIDTLTPEQRYVSDLNGDGRTDIFDALLILRRIKGYFPHNP